MTIRLDCDISDSGILLGNILTHTIKGERVMFFCEAGRGQAVMQRVRVKLSRIRNSQKNAGKKIRYFNLHNTIHPHTEDGKRMDCVVAWETTNLRHSMTQTLEDLVGHGDRI